MSFLDRALAQARELQKTVNEAATKAADQMKPLLKESIDNAQRMQQSLSEHAAETSKLAADQTRVMMEHLGTFVKMGSEVMRESADQTRATAEKMLEESRKIYEAALSAAGRKEDPPKS